MRSTYHRLHLRLPALATTFVALLLSAPSAGAAGGPTLMISGAGDGHGVGMSQDGALGYAEHGYSYETILAHYYTGTALGQAPAGVKVRVLMGGKVHTLALETYVQGVVSAEVPASWPLAALEAQAVASRTYALTAHAGGAKFDVYADTRSQVYRGVAAETPQTDAAIAATAGQIVTYEGRPAITYFFASSGGHTENVENAFPGALPEPWLRSVPDVYETGQSDWKLSMSFATVTARLKGLIRGSFRGIEVLARGVSPRILSAELLGSAGDTLLSGAELASRLGLDSTWAYFSVVNRGVVTPEHDRSGQSPAASAVPTPGAAASPSPASEEPATAPDTTGAQGGAPAPGTQSTSSAVTSSQGGSHAPEALATSTDGGAAAG
jgi:stage II sporulation protein D